jgi:hypothetical protein
VQGELVNVTRYRGRRAASIENASLRVTILQEGGHVAEIVDKATGVNPLWTPSWPTIEPSEYSSAHAALYGGGSDARLLAGIMGHNLCLDIFGPPSEEEARHGLTAHGEGAVAAYDLDVRGLSMLARTRLPIAGLEFQRRIELRDRIVAFSETLTNVSGAARAIGWTQHVTLGPPFLARGFTEFRASATRSKVFETQFGADDYLVEGAEFEWPFAPARDGRVADLRTFNGSPRSSAYTAHLMTAEEKAWFVAFSHALHLAFGYVWKAVDFPWMGIWEENHSRMNPPWSGHTMTRGMEFGVSPMPETRQAMTDRGTLFGVPAFRGIGADESITVDYRAILQPAQAIPEGFA